MGQPIAFVCPVARRERDVVWRAGSGPSYAVPDGHARIERTGRTRAKRDGRARGRSLDTLHEFRCECGHVGWSRHVGILRYPVEETTP